MHFLLVYLTARKPVPRSDSRQRGWLEKHTKSIWIVVLSYGPNSETGGAKKYLKTMPTRVTEWELQKENTQNKAAAAAS
jgi:hypothetical protein